MATARSDDIQLQSDSQTSKSQVKTGPKNMCFPVASWLQPKKICLQRSDGALEDFDGFWLILANAWDLFFPFQFPILPKHPADFPRIIKARILGLVQRNNGTTRKKYQKTIENPFHLDLLFWGRLTRFSVAVPPVPAVPPFFQGAGDPQGHPFKARHETTHLAEANWAHRMENGQSMNNYIDWRDDVGIFTFQYWI